jgi:hypothetical protein
MSGISKINVKTSNITDTVLKGNTQEARDAVEAITEKLKSDVDAFNNEENQAQIKNSIPVLLVFEKKGSWGTAGDSWAGYTGVMSIINYSGSALRGNWSVTFKSHGGLKMNGMWNGSISKNGDTYTIKAPSWNSKGIADHSHYVMGYNGVGVFSNVVDDIYDVAINGDPALAKYDMKKFVKAAKVEGGPVEEGEGYRGDDVDNEVGKEGEEETPAEKAKEKEKEDNYDNEVKLSKVYFHTTSSYYGGFSGEIILDLSNESDKTSAVLEMTKPSGMSLASYSCWGSGSCKIEKNKGKIKFTITPWGGDLPDSTKIKFSSSGALTSDVKIAKLNNLLTVVAYPSGVKEVAPAPAPVPVAPVETPEEKEKKDERKTTSSSTEEVVSGGDETQGGDVSGSRHNIAYMPSWSLNWFSEATAIKSELATMPKAYRILVLSFAKPDLTYTLGQNSFGSTGLQFSSSFAAVKEAVKSAHIRGVNVYLAIGGATYNSWASLASEGAAGSGSHIDAMTDLMKDLSLDGLDVDYEVGGADAANVTMYANSIKAIKIAATNAGNKKVSLAGWSTGADCTSQTSTLSGCSGKVSFWGGSAGRERLVFAQLGGKSGINNYIDSVGIMSYDGSYKRFDPVSLYNSYKEIYDGPLSIGVEIAKEAWGGAEVVITNADAENCSFATLRGNSYKVYGTNADIKDKAYSVERFAKALVGNPKDGLMIWSYKKSRSGNKCGRAADFIAISKAIDIYLEGGSSDIGEVTDELGKEDSGVTDEGSSKDEGTTGDNTQDAGKASDFTSLSNWGKGLEEWPHPFYAPYIDAGAYPALKINDISQETGHKLFTLAFLVADSFNPGCSVTWAGVIGMDKGPESWTGGYYTLYDQIKLLRDNGGDVMVSFGGAANFPVAATCKDVKKLSEVYINFIEKSQSHYVDFDIEGTWVSDKVSYERRNKALVLVRKYFEDKNWSLKIWYTFPVLPNGLTWQGVDIINDAKDRDLKLDGINVMTMDYGDSAAPTSVDMGTHGINAIKGLHAQLRAIYPTKSEDTLWKMIGTTPMIGLNDVTSENFTTNDAKATADFVKDKGVGMLANWSVNRDKPCDSSNVRIDCSSKSNQTSNYEYLGIFKEAQEK